MHHNWKKWLISGTMQYKHTEDAYQIIWVDIEVDRFSHEQFVQSDSDWGGFNSDLSQPKFS